MNTCICPGWCLRCLIVLAVPILVFSCGESDRTFASLAANLPQSAGLSAGSAAELSREDIRLLREGDIILRRGRGVTAGLIVRLMGDPEGFSHVGVLTKAEDSSFQVIHSIANVLTEDGTDGVQIQTLDEFCADGEPGYTAVTRIKAETSVRRGMAEAAETLLEQGHSFDIGFGLDLTKGIYCSELIWHILPEDVRGSAVRFKEPGGIILFDSFMDERFFSTILDTRFQG